MFATRARAQSASTVRIKTLNTPLSRDEQKDLEHQSDALPINQPDTEDRSVTEAETDQTASSLSSRALAIQSFLRDTDSVQAVVLRQDGSAEEVSYDGSSSSTRRLLGGRPSIVGEIEALSVLVVQPLSTDCSVGAAAVNSHTLPVPLCHHRAHGDYVLFRVESTAKAGDLSLEEYSQFVEDNKALTETALKHYNAESEQIRSNSPCHGTSKTAVATLRGALWTQIVSERADSAEVDIAEAVEQRVQELVDDAVAAEEGDDVDFDPDDDAEALAGDRKTHILHRFDSAVSAEDDRPWRVQLEDALEHIRSIGKDHGEHFAATLCSTFYELNGTEPALNQLTTLFAKIRADFANEAQEELDEDSDSDSETESESESELDAETEAESESEVEVDEEWRATLGRIRKIGSIDGEALAEQICDAFYDQNGEELSLEELTEIWEGAQDALAAEAQELSDDEDTECDSDSEVDHDLAERESEGEVDEEWQETLDQIRSTAMRDGRVLVHNVCDSFYDDNGEEISLEELTEIWEGVRDELAIEAQEDADSVDERQSDDGAAEYDPGNEDDAVLAQRDDAEDRLHELDHFLPVLLNTAMVSSESGGGVSWNVFFDEEQLCEAEESRNLERASKNFQSANGREPTRLELHRMKRFLTVPTELSEGTESELDSEEQSDGANDDDSAADGLEMIEIE